MNMKVNLNVPKDQVDAELRKLCESLQKENKTLKAKITRLENSTAKDREANREVNEKRRKIHQLYENLRTMMKDNFDLSEPGDEWA